MIGMERFYHAFQQHAVAKHSFEKDRFLDIRDGDTHDKGGFGATEGVLSRRYDDAALVGDKFNAIFNYFDQFSQKFVDAKFIYIFRNPISTMESFHARAKDPNDRWTATPQVGLPLWNANLSRALWAKKTGTFDMSVFQYETVFNTLEGTQSVFKVLGLAPPPPEVLQPFADRANELSRRHVPRNDPLRAFVAENANWGVYRELCDMARRERAMAGEFRTPD